MMNTEEKILLGDLNLVEYTREMTRWNAAGEIQEHNDLILTKGLCPFPTTCTAMTLKSLDDSEAVDAFNRIRSFYSLKKAPFSIHLRAHADHALETVCKNEKMFCLPEAPGMVAESPFEEKPISPGIEIRHIDDVKGVQDFAYVTRESYQTLQMPPHVADQIFATPDRLLKPHNDLVVAYDAGKPASAAMTLFSHGIAGLYWVGTLENQRGKGLAEACVSEVSNAAFRRGAALVVLQASKYGAPIYARMGFEEVTRYRWYLKVET